MSRREKIYLLLTVLSLVAIYVPESILGSQIPRLIFPFIALAMLVLFSRARQKRLTLAQGEVNGSVLTTRLPIDVTIFFIILFVLAIALAIILGISLRQVS